MALLIATGSVLSFLINPASGRIALASCVAFAVSSSGDALAYGWLRDRRWLVRANGSNVIGAALDSALFPLIAFGAALPWVMLGQLVAKLAGGLVWAWVLQQRRALGVGAGRV